MTPKGATPREVVQRYCDAWVRGDAATLVGLYADDIVLHYFGRNPLSGDHRGKPAALAALARISALTKRGTPEIHDVLSSDSHAAILARESWMDGGTPVAMERILLYHVRDGKLAECWIYDADQRTVDAILTSGDAIMSIDISVELEMSFPPERIAAVMFDPYYDAGWMKAVQESHRLDDKVGPGARVRRFARFLGRRISWVTEVIEQSPPRLLRLRIADGPFVGIVTYEIAATGAGAIVRIRNEGRPGQFGWMPGFLIRAAMRSSLRSDLKNLREVVANRGY